MKIKFNITLRATWWCSKSLSLWWCTCAWHCCDCIIIWWIMMNRWICWFQIARIYKWNYFQNYTFRIKTSLIPLVLQQQPILLTVRYFYCCIYLQLLEILSICWDLFLVKNQLELMNNVSRSFFAVSYKFF